MAVSFTARDVRPGCMAGAWRAYRHGLPAAELCSLRWTQIDLRQGRLHVNRTKGGCASVHPLRGPELRALRPLQGTSPYVFVTAAGTPVTTAWLEWVQRTGRAAGFEIVISPGVDLVGPLPVELQNVTLFAAGTVTTSKAPEAANAFVKFIASPAAAVVLKANGFEPG